MYMYQTLLLTLLTLCKHFINLFIYLVKMFMFYTVTLIILFFLIHEQFSYMTMSNIRKLCKFKLYVYVKMYTT